ncbi:MAG TPA: ferritin-like domain-containing protein [Rhodanobacteraceae bacterium]
MAEQSHSLHALAARCVASTDVAEKLALTTDVAARFASGALACDDPPVVAASISTAAGRPERPRLVSPRELPRRSLANAEGRAALIHAVAHIEFNAINLAWDAVARFRGLPHEYYRDWVGVAVDEARHFSLLSARLGELGYAYGDFAAHDGLWDMAVRTAGSCLERMALVPRVLEARGLDVTPGMIARLRAARDEATADILEIILREEVAHVAAGSRWFAWCCAAARVDPAATFESLIARHLRGALRGPFNTEARLRAGFTAAELAQLDAVANAPRAPTDDLAA